MKYVVVEFWNEFDLDPTNVRGPFEKEEAERVLDELEEKDSPLMYRCIWTVQGLKSSCGG